MTILEVCDEVLVKVKELHSREEAHSDAKKYRTRKDELAPLSVSLTDDLARSRILRAKGVPIPKFKMPANVLTIAEEFLSTLEDPELGQRNTYGRLRTGLERTSEALQGAIKDSVNKLESPLGAVEEPVLKQLETVPAFKHKIEMVRQKKGEYERAASQKFRTPPDLDAFLTKRSELLLLGDELKHEALPPEVQEFFRAVRSNQASIDKLTETVRKWLAEHDQLRDLRIIIVPR
jgi:stalled ribosome alternative rescue factor ArfA